jgi:hypothetical protein
MCVNPPDLEQVRQRGPGVGEIHDLHLCVDTVMCVSTYISNQFVAEDGYSSIGTIVGLSTTNETVVEKVLLSVCSLSIRNDKLRRAG